jgi:hypothetical protein
VTVFSLVRGKFLLGTRHLLCASAKRGGRDVGWREGATEDQLLPVGAILFAHRSSVFSATVAAVEVLGGTFW